MATTNPNLSPAEVVALGLTKLTCKPGAWIDARPVTNPRTVELATGSLPVYENNHPNPCATFLEDRERFHIAVFRGRRYLVNTEGYDYARYIGALDNAI